MPHRRDPVREKGEHPVGMTRPPVTAGLKGDRRFRYGGPTDRSGIPHTGEIVGNSGKEDHEEARGLEGSGILR